MNNPEEYNKTLTALLKDDERIIRNKFDSALKREFTLRKNEIDEFLAKDEVSHKLKELLGNK